MLSIYKISLLFTLSISLQTMASSHRVDFDPTDITSKPDFHTFELHSLAQMTNFSWEVKNRVPEAKFNINRVEGKAVLAETMENAKQGYASYVSLHGPIKYALAVVNDAYWDRICPFLEGDKTPHSGSAFIRKK